MLRVVFPLLLALATFTAGPALAGMILTCSGTHALVVNVGDELITIDGRSFPVRATESRSKRRLEMTNDQGLTFNRYPERTSPDGFHHELDLNGRSEVYTNCLAQSDGKHRRDRGVLPQPELSTDFIIGESQSGDGSRGGGGRGGNEGGRGGGGHGGGGGGGHGGGGGGRGR